jgi:hypothetical protein
MDEQYWKDNYSEPDTMDCIVNAKEHANYLKALCKLDSINIGSIADFGFGMGVLFKTFLKKFRPKFSLGLEPSSYMYEKFDLTPFDENRVELLNIDLLSWCKQESSVVYDLGISTSVFQYLEDQELENIIRILSERVKYLYLTVPTDKELFRQRTEIEFHDRYAISRSKSRYQKIIGQGFTIVSNRLLESKYYFNENNTNFSELLFRA